MSSRSSITVASRSRAVGSSSGSTWSVGGIFDGSLMPAMLPVPVQDIHRGRAASG
jgi:hypothetical protein